MSASSQNIVQIHCRNFAFQIFPLTFINLLSVITMKYTTPIIPASSKKVITVTAISRISHPEGKIDGQFLRRNL